ncbi:aminopeptidase N-like [Diorhabda carinulata]|uniref:aminopeptidase N-like n=1 Tax=Diorhabda carinulata TaxID=1163345 RepID=UPI0025A284CB|nr:aminopeptidase N-like [Diorhabda carinulata]
MKMWRLITLFIIFFTGNDVYGSIYENYRLPNTSIPSRYQIMFSIPTEVLTRESNTFTGAVIIRFQVTKPTDVVHLHSAVNISSMSLKYNENFTVAINNVSTNYTTEILTVKLTKNITVGIDYDLEIEYFGTVETVNLHGLYVGQYTVNDTVEYLLATQFEATNARRVFPCFDEPQYKATFALSISYPMGFVAFSNTPGFVDNFDEENHIATRTFSETLRMSTYLLAFTITKFTCTSRIVGSTFFEVCSRNSTIKDRELALEYGIKIVETLDKWTNYYHNVTNIKKLGQVALPEFEAGAMENWGMITYRELTLLWNENLSGDIYKQQILSIISHEFSHMWFGNLVTTKWWDSVFLNEGFARYFQYFILHQIDGMGTFEMDKQFIIDQQYSALLEDGTSNNNSLIHEAWTPEQISNKFDIISYNKGACIIRMIENLVGTNIFQSALRQYIKNNVFESTTPDDLWEAFTQVIPNGTLRESIPFTEFIKNWIKESGYPIVIVQTNGSNVILTQKRFSYENFDDKQWYVPITYKLSGSQTFETAWLKPNRSLQLNNVLSDNGWIVINHNSQGYYRVHYDSIMLERLTTALKSDINQFSDLDRAQIVDDILNLASSTKMEYSEVFKILQYVKNETSYYPLYAAIKSLDGVKNIFGNDSILGKKMNNMVLELTENIINSVSFTNWTTINQISVLKFNMLWTTVCSSGQEKCILETTKLYQQFKRNEIKIHPNQRYLVYCNAIRYSSNIQEDWNFLWNRLHEIDQPHEIRDILNSLGCTSNNKYLETFLTQSINSSSVIRLQDITTVWSTVCKNNPNGVDIAFDYFTKNYEQILNYYTKGMSLFRGIVSMCTNQNQLAKVQKFYDQQPNSSSLSSSIKSGLQTIEKKLKFKSTVEKDLMKYFGLPSSASSTSALCISLLLSIVIFI